MTPAQYRALERLADAADGIGGLILSDRHDDDPTTLIHPSTAEALERRGLAIILEYDEAPSLAIITDEGAELLERSAPIEETVR